EAVEDWAKMQHRAQESVALLRDGDLPADRRTEADTAAELMAWLAQNHFTFLGYREYRYQAADSATGTPARYVSVPATGLGILRADVDDPGSFHALPVLERPQLMVITKDNHKSRVHRPAYLDYLGIRVLD
ncbi:NAD-glutamate dehydrogenase, partial [Xanthomonas citri pv. citri]